MLTVTSTRVVRFVVPVNDLDIEHAYRCQQQRITELPQWVIVTYAAGIPFALRVVRAPSDLIFYVDSKGWVFDENVITKLLMSQTLRDAVDEDI